MPNIPASNQLNHAVSAVSNSFFRPFNNALSNAKNTYLCHAISDQNWLQTGVLRCLENFQSGRDLLQSLNEVQNIQIGLTTLFESLKSSRRLALTREVNLALLGDLVDANQCVCPQKSPSACPWREVDPTGSLDAFDLYAGDGHFHAAACHDPVSVVSRRKTNNQTEHLVAVKYPVGQIFTLNLRTQGLNHLTVADQVERNKEHEMRAIKRLTHETLRQGAKTGCKVLYIWDKAGIDFRFWYDCKYQSGIYFLSREKENMKLEVLGVYTWNGEIETNQGVLADEIVGSSNGVQLRRVEYRDAETELTYTYLTNLPVTVAPGLVAYLYKRRWDIEKTFDELKNKLGEKKSWATSAAAKSNQAVLLCVTHNLLTLLDRKIEVESGVVNVAEVGRKAAMLKSRKEVMLAKGKVLPKVAGYMQRLTVRTVKFIRWVRNHFHSPATWEEALAHLTRIYARL
jgi:hypothetical protein